MLSGKVFVCVAMDGAHVLEIIQVSQVEIHKLVTVSAGHVCLAYMKIDWLW